MTDKDKTTELSETELDQVTGAGDPGKPKKVADTLSGSPGPDADTAATKASTSSISSKPKGFVPKVYVEGTVPTRSSDL